MVTSSKQKGSLFFLVVESRQNSFFPVCCGTERVTIKEYPGIISLGSQAELTYGHQPYLPALAILRGESFGRSQPG